MRIRLGLLLFAILLVPITARAVTVRDLIELKKAGLPDDVLVAVIDADRTIFTLDKDQILTLKKAGISETVLLKMLSTRREFDTPPEAPAPIPATSASVEELPGVVVIGGKAESKEPSADYPQFGYPLFFMSYPIWGTPPPRGHRPPPAPFFPYEQRGFGRFINDGWIGKP